jgi:hypothetical protein
MSGLLRLILGRLDGAVEIAATARGVTFTRCHDALRDVGSAV